MPRVLDLMEVGFTAIQSKHLGAQPVNGDFNNLTAAGNASQADAYQIEANYNIFQTVGATTNSAKLPVAESDPHGIYLVLNLGANALNLYPAVGDSFNDLAANAALSLPVDTGVLIVKQTGTSWQAQRTYGALSTSGFVPYTGATANVNLGAFTITASNLSGTNTGDVTLAGTPDYITISGQTITRGQIDLTTDVTGILPTANGGTGSSNATIAFGTYTPTLTNVLNLDGSTAFTSQYMRIGSVVTVSGRFNADATAAASTVTQLRISLPIASNFSATEQAGGTATIGASAAALILANAANDAVEVTWRSVSAANEACSFTFTYQII